jgi:hypothetical protein
MSETDQVVMQDTANVERGIQVPNLYMGRFLEYLFRIKTMLRLRSNDTAARLTALDSPR